MIGSENINLSKTLKTIQDAIATAAAGATKICLKTPF